MRRQPEHLSVNLVDHLAGQHEHDKREQEQRRRDYPASQQYPGERVEEVSGGVGHFLALRLFSMAELSVHRTEIQRACYLVG